MKRYLQRLKLAAEENPLAAAAIAVALISATAKFVEAYNHNTGARAYAKQVDYRVKNKK
jgi:benzoyl-CoA reductase/2-hydroxyglutaryl-CoA dehydratase subunit BcrC/BadD/HgdB